VTARDGEYVQRLGEVLRQRDVGALRTFLMDQAGRYGGEQQIDAIRQQSDAEIEAILHRMIVSRPDLGDLHAESERWLAAHGGAPSRQPPERQPSSAGTRRRNRRPPHRAQRHPGSEPSAN
jgi:hypothetical protein